MKKIIINPICECTQGITSKFPILLYFQDVYSQALWDTVSTSARGLESNEGDCDYLKVPIDVLFWFFSLGGGGGDICNYFWFI